MKKHRFPLVPLVALAGLLAVPVAAEQKPITAKDSLTMKATIEAIDHDARIITLKDSKGEYEDIYAGPEVKRFDELKVGDKVTFKYTESMVFEIRKPGESAPPSASGAPAVTRHPTMRPSASVTQRETATVTVKNLDPKTGSISVATEDGHLMSFKVKKAALKGINPGDRVVMTYDTGLLVSVE